MSELEKIMERSHHSIRPEAPPPGQWEQLHDQLQSAYQTGVSEEKPVRSRPRRFLHLPLLALAGALLFLTKSSYQPIDTHELAFNSPVVTPAPPLPEIPQIEPLAAPNQPVPTINTATILSDSHIPIPLAVTANASQAPQGYVEAGIQSGSHAEPVAELPTISFSLPPKPVVGLTSLSISPPPAPATSQFGPVRSASTSGLRPELVRPLSTSLSAGVNFSNSLTPSAHPLPPARNRPDPHWEIGFHTMAFPFTFTENLARYTTTDNGNNSQLFVLNDGSTVNLFRDGIANDVNDENEGWLFNTHLEVARQFGSGWRIGIGFLAFGGDYGTDETVDDVLPDVQGLEYLRFTDRNQFAFFNTMHVQYTFRQRRKLRYSLGVVIFNQLFRYDYDYQFLYAQNTSDVHLIRGRESFNWRFLPVSLILPQLGFQYQVAPNISLGLEIGPGFGIGGRYHFRPRP